MSPVRLVDITRAAGITFRHNNGASGLKLYPESMGSGVSFLDYDGDGYQDIFLVNGRDWTAQEARAYTRGVGRVHSERYGFVPPSPLASVRRRTVGALYRNNRDGTFSDVTQNSGLGIEMQGMGAAVGDYDNDGRPDLYVTSFGRNFLFHNESAGAQAPRFREVAGQSGTRDSGYGTSAAWLDYDRDGRLDLFVCRYIEWSPAIDIWNFGSTQRVNGAYRKTYSGPTLYDGQASHLYRNLGGGRFADVSGAAGISPRSAASRKASAAPSVDAGPPKTMKDVRALLAQPSKQRGKAMGVSPCDFNQDGWPDILVSNDQVRNYLYENKKNGTFAEVGTARGVAYGPRGKARAGMGVDVGDIDHSGRDSVVIGNFSDESIGLYRDIGQGLFEEIAGPAQVAISSSRSVTFGCLFLDVNNDGWLDILAANGHVQDTIHDIRRDLDYPQRPLLYINRGQKQPIQFDEAGLQSGPALGKPMVARGLACADIDLDGDVDAIFTVNGGAPLLLRNEAASPATRNNALRLTLQGSRSNRSAIGARVEARLKLPGQAGSTILRRVVKSGSSYLSQNELPLTIGTGKQAVIESLAIRWPSGGQTLLRNVASNQAITVLEGKGIVRAQPLARR